MDEIQLSAAEWHTGLQALYDERVVRQPLDHPFAVTSVHDLDLHAQQPALLDDIFCIHRGGAKRVSRTREGHRRVYDVEVDSLTVMPRYRDAYWETEGPDRYLHLTLSPKPFDRLLNDECGLTRADIDFRDEVGFVSPVLVALAGEMERVAAEGGEGRLYVDTLFTAFSLALLRHATDVPEPPKLVGDDGRSWSGGMAGWRLRQIVEFMAEHRREDIGLDDLTAVSGLSRAHFFRTFRQATGATPRQYLERMRVDDARRAIERGGNLVDVAAAAGFGSVIAMSRAFRRVLSISPARYRSWYR